MIPETETASPAAVINDGNGSDATITRASNTSKSSASNRVQRRGRGVRTGRGGHQGHGGISVRFNRPAYTSSISNFKGEVENFGTVIGTTAKEI